MVLIFLLATSALLQFGAAYVAFRLTRLTSARKALVVIAVAMSLMAIPRLFTLSRIILNSPGVVPDLTIEVVVFAISALMVVALIEIGPHIQPSNLATLALQESEKKFRRLSEAAFGGIVVTDKGIFVEVSPQFAKLFGYRRKELLGMRASDLMAPEIRDESMGRLLSGYDQAYESVGMRKDGTTFPLEVCGKNFRFQGREHRVAAVRDITERKQAAGEIERLKEFTEGILQSMSEGVVVDDSQGHFRFVNQAAAILLGYEPEELLGKHWTNFVPSNQQDIIHAANERRRRGKADRYEIELKRKNGTRFPPLISDGPRIVGDELRGTMAVFTDVTTRKQREREQGAIVAVATSLRSASRREDMLPIILDQLLNLLDAEAAALVMRDPDTSEAIAELGRGIWANWTGERLPPGKGISGYVIESGEFYSTNDVHRDPLFARHDLMGDVDALICAPLIAYEETIGALLVGRRQGFDEGEIHILTAIADMAANALYRTNLMETLERRVLKRTRELEEANERLMELDQLKSDFVSNVSHELRTPITNIMLYLNLMDRQTKREQHSRYMQILRAESTRLAHLIEDLLTLSRLEQGHVSLSLEPHVLDALIAEILTAHQASAKDKSISLHHEPNPEVPPVFISRDQMVQVFTNLVSNAIAYTYSEGHVTMSSDLTEVDGDQHVTIRIHNDAPAIPPEDLPHIFERFYRGKVGRESGEPGTGLGLSICKEIVELHHGWIEVTSNEVQGTTFTLCMPVTHPQA